MENRFLEQMKARLTPDSSRLLNDVFAPREVAVPPADAWRSLCVLRDGRVRVYGNYEPEKSTYGNAPDCYIESADCGLSWSTHLVREPGLLLSATYHPGRDLYCNVVSLPGKGTFFRYAPSPDDRATEVFITATEYIDVRLPFVLSTGRVITVVHERRRELHPTAFFAVLLVTDDFGRTWKEVKLEPAPFFEVRPPHKGFRWQQNNRENTLEELPDGTLVMLSRTAQDFHYVSRSHDGGLTWTRPAPSRFHATGTMPLLQKLSDGRLLLLWCNTQPLPELETADGVWEDVFTNRDASHAAVSEDNGAHWIGYRELRLNPWRNSPDFRSVGGVRSGKDKSVHQFEVLELPFGKVLVVSGQNEVCRRVTLFDLRWLYEKSRTEDFLEGMGNLSVQVYLRSHLGGWRGPGYAGHCAYNRVPGAVMVPDPAVEKKEALSLARLDDERLISRRSGAVWNFPATRRGRVTVRAIVGGQPLRISLLDHWRNPGEETIAEFAAFSYAVTAAEGGGAPFDYVLTFNLDTETVSLTLPGGKKERGTLSGVCPDGLCYLHLQTGEDDRPGAGVFVEFLSAEAI